MMGGYGWNMMSGHGFGMLGIGFLGWLLNLGTIALVVYFAVKLALKNNK